jgi:hypothetical protein
VKGRPALRWSRIWHEDAPEGTFARYEGRAVVRVRGRWVDDPPSWLRKNTPVSLGGNTLARGEFNGWKITRDVLVKEISLVSSAMEPAQAGARGFDPPRRRRRRGDPPHAPRLEVRQSSSAAPSPRRSLCAECQPLPLRVGAPGSLVGSVN